MVVFESSRNASPSDVIITSGKPYVQNTATGSR
jgi:hypothetical protein